MYISVSARLFALSAAGWLAGCVVASSPPPPPPSPRVEFQPQGPAYGSDQRYCDRAALGDVFRPTTGNVVGTAAGAAAGGLIGSQFGKSSGNTAATITGILAGALEHASTGEPIAWQNPRNGSSYWVTPTRTFVQPDGRPCRYYTTEELANGARREAYTGYACRQADGNWRNER